MSAVWISPEGLFVVALGVILYLVAMNAAVWVSWFIRRKR